MERPIILEVIVVKPPRKHIRGFMDYRITRTMITEVVLLQMID
jgi:hypothetical protein